MPTPLTIRRYDGQADWYDAYNAPGAAALHPCLQRLLGPGQGLCLDLGCGTGHYLQAIRAAGWTPVGVDVSADQLRLARSRGSHLIQADAVALPFANRAFSAAAVLWLSTDVDDFSLVLTEVVRVVERAGRVVFLGAHPCFNGPCVEFRDDGSRIVHTNYRAAGWHPDAPWWGENIRRRVGMRHVPLAELFTAFPGAGLHIERVVEPHEVPVPWAIGIQASVV